MNVTYQISDLIADVQKNKDFAIECMNSNMFYTAKYYTEKCISADNEIDRLIAYKKAQTETQRILVSIRTGDE